MTPTEYKAAMNRIHEATYTRTQMTLADILGIRQSSISDAKRRGSIPDAWLVALLRLYHLNPDWILTGQGCKYMAYSDRPYFVVAKLPENPASGTPLEKVLQSIIESVTTARAKHSYLGRSFDQAVCAVRSESLEWESQAILSQEPDGVLCASRLDKAHKESLDCITVHIRFLLGDYLVPEGWQKEPQ